jgi:hypothetical protein
MSIRCLFLQTYQAPTELRLARHLSGLSRLSRMTLTASGASHGIPDWVASLTTLRALDVRMECRCAALPRHS